MGLIHDIGKGPIGIDTCIFIYLIEENIKYNQILIKIFEAIDNGHLLGVTSSITLLETLIIPLRKQDQILASQYERFLTQSYGLKLLDLNLELIRNAAALRASYDIKTPDALQIAAAKQENCTVFLTNDRRLPSIPGLKILQLSDYLPTNS